MCKVTRVLVSATVRSPMGAGTDPRLLREMPMPATPASPRRRLPGLANASLRTKLLSLVLGMALLVSGVGAFAIVQMNRMQNDAEDLARMMAAYARDPIRVRREGLAAAAFMRDRGLDLWVRDVAEFVESLP